MIFSVCARNETSELEYIVFLSLNIAIKEFKIYSFQVDKVFATSINDSNFELKNSSIKSFNCNYQFINLSNYLFIFYSLK